MLMFQYLFLVSAVVFHLVMNSMVDFQVHSLNHSHSQVASTSTTICKYYDSIVTKFFYNTIIFLFILAEAKAVMVKADMVKAAMVKATMVKVAMVKVVTRMTMTAMVKAVTRMIMTAMVKVAITKVMENPLRTMAVMATLIRMFLFNNNNNDCLIYHIFLVLFSSDNSYSKSNYKKFVMQT